MSDINKKTLDDFEITEKDFYPPEDKRLYNSVVEDIHNGDSFAEYIKWFFDNYENDIFDNNN